MKRFDELEKQLSDTKRLIADLKSKYQINLDKLVSKKLALMIEILSIKYQSGECGNDAN